MIEQVTHYGTIEIAETQLKTMVTKSGKRLITATSAFSAIGKQRRGSQRVAGYPKFVDARNIVPFIDEELKREMQPIEYKAKNGSISKGYNATIIPKVADLYISAHDAGVLTQAQEAVYQRSLIIVRSLAKVGITALIDEATGYQADREGQALQKLLSAYISEDLMKWQSRFPREYYSEIYRLYGIEDEFDPHSVKRPQWIGGFTNKYVYGIFPDTVMEEIKRLNPPKQTSRGTMYRGHKNFQHLIQDVGVPQLDRHLSQLIIVMRMSDNIDDFKEKFRTVFSREIERKEFQDDVKNGLVPLFETIDE